MEVIKMETIKLNEEDTQAVIKSFENLSEAAVISTKSFDKFKDAAMKHKDLIQSEENEGWF